MYSPAALGARPVWRQAIDWKGLGCSSLTRCYEIPRGDNCLDIGPWQEADGFMADGLVLCIWAGKWDHPPPRALGKFFWWLITNFEGEKKANFNKSEL